jgi:hypothetical protein
VALDGIARKLADPSQSLKDWLAAMIGTAVHKWLEEQLAEHVAKAANEAGTPQWLVEHRMIMPFLLDPADPESKRTLGGTIDLFDITGTVLWDYKVVPEFSLGKKGKDYGFQQNAYRVMLAKMGFAEPQHMYLIELARDWSDPEKGSQKAKKMCPVYIEEVPRDDNVTFDLLVKLARERVHYKELFKKAWIEAKPTRAKAESVALELSKNILPPCQSDFTHEWGVLPTGIPRKCMYCSARKLCHQVNG